MNSSMFLNEKEFLENKAFYGYFKSADLETNKYISFIENNSKDLYLVRKQTGVIIPKWILIKTFSGLFIQSVHNDRIMNFLDKAYDGDRAKMYEKNDLKYELIFINESTFRIKGTENSYCGYICTNEYNTDQLFHKTEPQFNCDFVFELA